MANPFSGLENIGQSYLAGVQLAQQRQLREEAIAQRQEEARIRERYYQDLVQQRADAAALNARLREETLATKFGKFLKYKPDGSIDIVGSATAQEEAGNRNQLLETVGFAETQGISIPGVELTPEERKSEFYNRGRAQGIVQKTKDQLQMERILASQGLFRAGRAPVSTAPVEPMITGERPETIFDILSAEPRRTPSARSTPSRASLLGAPTSMVPVRINNQDYVTRAPRAEKPAEPEYVATIEMETPLGPAKVKKTASELAELMAKRDVDTEANIFADLDAAEKQLRDLRVKKGVKEFNVERGENGELTVVEDSWLSSALTPAEVQKQISEERERRAGILKETGRKTTTQSRVQSQFGPTLMEFGGGSEAQPQTSIGASDLPNFIFDKKTGSWLPSR